MARGTPKRNKPVTDLKGTIRKPVRPVTVAAMNPKGKYRLEELMAEIPEGTKFEEFDVGPPVGKEVL